MEASVALKQIDAEAFETEVKNAAGPVVVDFYGQDCAPCRKLLPIVEEVAKEFEGKATFVKGDVEDLTDVAVAYGVFQVPTLLFFKGGELVDKMLGLVPKAQLKSRVQALVG